MNLFDLGGQLLRVGRAVTPPEGVTSAASESTQSPLESGGSGGAADAAVASLTVLNALVSGLLKALGI